jgi:anti-sigma-K factor RskA
MNHEQIAELIAVRSLGGLDGPDVELLARELANHGDCAECRAIEDEMAETAAMLAAVLDPEPVSPEMIDAILAAPVPQVVAIPDSAPPVPTTDDLSARRVRRTSLRAIVAVAAAVAVVVAGGALATRLHTSVPVRSAALSQQIVHFQGGNGTLTMAYTPGQPGAVLFGHGLPQLQAGQVYEIWTITANHPVSAACTPSADGSLDASVGADMNHVELMAVTIEASACPSAPTTAPILTAPVRAS